MSPAEPTYGVRAVEELLRAGRRRCQEILILPGRHQGPLARIRQAAVDRGIPVIESDRARLGRLAGRGHQGVVALAEPPVEQDLPGLLEAVEPPELLVILDGVQDPQNLGSILRSAAALGAGGVILPQRRAVGLTPVVIKVAAGAVEWIPIARVANLARALRLLRERGIWLYGLAEEGESGLHRIDLTGPCGLVLGGEGEGLRSLTAKGCDALARLPTREGFGTLNVAAACAASLGEVARQRDSDDLRLTAAEDGG